MFTTSKFIRPRSDERKKNEYRYSISYPIGILSKSALTVPYSTTGSYIITVDMLSDKDLSWVDCICLELRPTHVFTYLWTYMFTEVKTPRVKFDTNGTIDLWKKIRSESLRRPDFDSFSLYCLVFSYK